MRGRVTGLIALLALLAIVLAGCSSSPASGGDTEPTGDNGATPGPGYIEWLYDWQEALSKAQSEGKPVMVDFYNTSCHMCTLLDEKTYTDAAIITFLSENFINVKIDEEGSPLARRFGVEGLPTILFATPDGVEIGRATGYRSPYLYRRLALEMLERWEEIAG